MEGRTDLEAQQLVQGRWVYSDSVIHLPSLETATESVRISDIQSLSDTHPFTCVCFVTIITNLSTLFVIAIKSGCSTDVECAAQKCSVFFFK